jgi:membrane protein DedA with SNARE-associated domain
MLLHTVMIQYIRASLAKPSAAALAITAGVFVQEDVTTVAVGMMAADLLVPIPLAMVSLVVATVLNNFAMYGIGRLALSFPRLRRWVESRNRLALRALLDDRLVSTVVTTQFLPGMRLPIFTTCGFFKLSFRRFAASVICVAPVWSPLVFTCAYFYGFYALSWFGIMRWPIALILVLILAMAGRTHWKNFTKDYPADCL